MAMKALLAAILPLLISFPAWAGILTAENLQGPWVFAYWVEEGNETNKRDVKVPMEFRPDGTVVRTERTRTHTAYYEIKKDTIIYIDNNSRQEWKLVSFVPGKSFTVNHKGTLMFFEKEQTP